MVFGASGLIGSLAQAKGEAIEETTEIPTEADLLVVGAGAAGLAAAAGARENGQTVIVLEAGGRVGGAASLSAGNLTIISDEMNKAAGRNDEALQKYLSYKPEEFEGKWAEDLLTLQQQIQEYLASDRRWDEGSQCMDPVRYVRFAAVGRTGRHNHCADGVVAVPQTSYFPHLMQGTVCSRASSVEILTALGAKKSEKSTIYYLTLRAGVAF